MTKEFIINKTLNEYRAALLENGEIIDFLMQRGDRVEKNDNFPALGNIYKGKVLKVLPGMQSAFVDIGHEKAAFLYVDDAYIPTLEEQREMGQKSKEEEEKSLDSKNVSEVIPDELSTFSEVINMKFRKDISIEQILKEGDEIVVQVAKEAISTKGPRVTRHITLAGRYVVYMPFIEHSGVSRRIENEEERNRLKDILDSVCPEGMGVIARTVAEGQSYKTLKADFNMLVKMWKETSKSIEKSKAPTLLYKDLDFIQRVLRDITDEDLDAIVVDDRDALREVEKFTNKYLPHLKGKSKLYDNDVPIFEHYGIDMELERALSNKVFLKSGGSINIDQTEALVSIDVNTGKFVGRKNLEETILKTNLEAVKEIAYQLRLRNCGGIIIIDFIDMTIEENKETVYHALVDALKKDRAKTNVFPLSGLGLIEMTRKRTRDTLIRTMCAPCPYCEGIGRVKTTLTVCYELLRSLNKILKKTAAGKVLVYAHPEVAARLSGDDLDAVEMLEKTTGKTLIMRSENSYHIEQYEIFPQLDS